MQKDESFRSAYDTAGRMLGMPLDLPLSAREPANARNFIDLWQHNIHPETRGPALA